VQPGVPVVGATQGFVQQFPGQQFPGQQYPGQPSPAAQNSGQNITDPNTNLTTLQSNFNAAAPNTQNPTAVPTVPVYPPVGQAGFQGAFGTATTGSPTAGVFANGSATPGAVNPGAGTPGVPGNTALNAINTLLTTPRQTPPPVADNGTVNTGGLAGVASTYKAASIKVYKDRHKYNEWEFIFDLKSGIPGQQPAAAPTAAQSPTGQVPPGQSSTGQTTGQTTTGQGAGQTPSTFAPSTTFSQPTNSSTTH